METLQKTILKLLVISVTFYNFLNVQTFKQETEIKIPQRQKQRRGLRFIEFIGSFRQGRRIKVKLDDEVIKTAFFITLNNL